MSTTDAAQEPAAKAPPKPPARKAAEAKPAAKAEPKKKTPPKYGGTKGEPDLGANGRRLMKYIQDAHPKEAKGVLAEAVKRTRTDDRFVRYETIIEVAQEKGFEEVTESLKRKLASGESARNDGLVGSVKD